MKNLFNQNSLAKWIIVYLSTVLLGYLLFPAVWGGVNGIMVAGRIVNDPAFDKEVMKDIGEQPHKRRISGRDFHRNKKIK